MPAPSPFFLQHVEGVEAPAVDDHHFRTAWRKLTRLHGLLIAQWITDAEFRAAVAFRDLHDTTRPGGHSALAVLISTGIRPAPAELIDFRIDAANRLRVIEAWLGRPAYRLLVLLIAEDTPWITIARWYDLDERTAKKRVVDAIRRLNCLTS